MGKVSLWVQSEKENEMDRILIDSKVIDDITLRQQIFSQMMGILKNGRSVKNGDITTSKLDNKILLRMNTKNHDRHFRKMPIMILFEENSENDLEQINDSIRKLNIEFKLDVSPTFISNFNKLILDLEKPKSAKKHKIILMMVLVLSLALVSLFWIFSGRMP